MWAYEHMSNIQLCSYKQVDTQYFGWNYTLGTIHRKYWPSSHYSHYRAMNKLMGETKKKPRALL